jgi:hypothetical protein
MPRGGFSLSGEEFSSTDSRLGVGGFSFSYLDDVSSLLVALEKTTETQKERGETRTGRHF